MREINDRLDRALEQLLTDFIQQQSQNDRCRKVKDQLIEADDYSSRCP